MKFIMQLFRFWLLLALILMTGALALFNQEIISVSLPPLIQQISVPSYQAYAGFLFIGSTLTLVFFGIDSLKQALTIRNLRKKVSELELLNRPEKMRMNNSEDVNPHSELSTQN